MPVKKRNKGGIMLWIFGLLVGLIWKLPVGYWIFGAIFALLFS